MSKHKILHSKNWEYEMYGDLAEFLGIDLDNVYDFKVQLLDDGSDSVLVEVRYLNNSLSIPQGLLVRRDWFREWYRKKWGTAE